MGQSCNSRFLKQQKFCRVSVLILIGVIQCQMNRCLYRDPATPAASSSNSVWSLSFRGRLLEGFYARLLQSVQKSLSARRDSAVKSHYRKAICFRICHGGCLLCNQPKAAGIEPMLKDSRTAHLVVRIPRRSFPIARVISELREVELLGRKALAGASDRAVS